MESIHPRKSDFLPLNDRLAVLSLALLVCVTGGVEVILSNLSGGGDGGGGGGLGCSTPPTETEVDGGRIDEADGCLVGEGAVDRVLGVVLKRPAESRGGLDMLD